MQTPLHGIRVLDFTRVLAGPHCTRMLADLGAEVIKVEPPDGDVTRFSAPRRGGMPSYYAQQNTGKRSISLDLSRADGAAIVTELAERCDVVVENFRPGVMAKLGIGFEQLGAVNPRLVFASISGYGQTGPWKNRRAYASVVHAELGITKSQGDQLNGDYQNDRHSHADVYTAIETCSGILAALYQRERTGRGQHVDVAMAQTILYVNEHTHNDLWDEDVDPGWIRGFGNEHHPVVMMANGERAIIAGHPAQNGTFEMFLGAIGRLDLAQDPRFVNQRERLVHLDELKAEITAYALTLPDAVALEARCSQFKLAVGAIRSVADAAASDWARERDVIRDIDDRSGGRLRLPNAPWKFSDAPHVGLVGTPRYRGEDNAEVLRDVLGYDDERIAQLTADGVLSEHLPSRR